MTDDHIRRQARPFGRHTTSCIIFIVVCYAFILGLAGAYVRLRKMPHTPMGEVEGVLGMRERAPSEPVPGSMAWSSMNAKEWKRGK